MNLEKVKAPPACDSGALENVVAFPAINVFENTKPHREIQAIFIARRHRLAPSHARAIADLVFREVRP